MSLKNKIMKLIFITFIVIMWNGCAETIYYNANLNKNFKIDEKNKFYIIEINRTTQEEKKFTNMLKSKMIQNGYQFIDKKSTDYAIFVKLGEIDFNFNPKKKQDIYKQIDIVIFGKVNDKWVKAWNLKISTKIVNYKNYQEAIINEIVALIGQEFHDSIAIKNSI